MLERSREHLRAAGETYWQHFRFAQTVGLLALAAGVACLIHAFVPALCTRTASRTIGQLNQLFAERERLQEVDCGSAEARAFVLLLVLATAVTAPLWVLGAPLELSIGYTLLAYGLPLALLLTNPELEPEDKLKQSA
jgi:hypothetical protein